MRHHTDGFSKEEIEYPVAGGGIYSRPADYVAILQNLLAHYLSLTTTSAPPSTRLLSDPSVLSLFTGTLPDSAKAGLVKMYNPYLDIADAKQQLRVDDADWSTAMAIFRPNGGDRREGWGRKAKSVGWGGAAGTEYWIDPETGIAVRRSSTLKLRTWHSGGTG
jgi:methyl acetate hydrolase